MGNFIRKKTPIILFLLLLFLSYIKTINIYADNTISPAIIAGITDEEAKERFYRVSLRNCEIEELKGSPIKTLVVGNEWVAIGTNENTVGIFDLDGKFIYGVRFNTDGAYELYTDRQKENLIIFIVRNSTAFSYDNKGNIVMVKAAESESDLAGTVSRNKTDSMGNSYELQQERGIKRAFARGYSKVNKKNLHDDVIIFYESGYSVSWLKITIIIIIIICVFLMVDWMSSFPELQKKRRDFLKIWEKF